MALGPHNLLFTEYQGLFPWGKVAGSFLSFLTAAPSGAEVKNDGSCTCTLYMPPQHAQGHLYHLQWVYICS